MIRKNMAYPCPTQSLTIHDRNETKFLKAHNIHLAYATMLN
jgi:hypothetical protein